METARELAQNTQLPLDLLALSNSYGFLAAKMKELENPKLSLHESLTILDAVISRIQSAVGPHAEKVKSKIKI
jgi:hypothetical protein